MNILLITDNDLVSHVASCLLWPTLKRLSDAQHQVHIALPAKSKQYHPSEHKPQALLEIEAIEKAWYLNSLVPALEQTQLTNVPDSLEHSTKLSFKQMALQLGTELLWLEQINHADSIEQLASLKLDLIISIRFPQILKEAVIALPRLGIFNLHSGILPNYRGVMATFWSMLNQEAYIGTSLHSINDPQIDKGELFAISQQKVNYQQCYLSNVLALYPDGVAMVEKALHSLIQCKPLPTVSVNAQPAQYYSFPQTDDYLAFINQGMQLINYQQIQRFCADFYQIPCLITPQNHK